MLLAGTVVADPETVIEDGAVVVDGSLSTVGGVVDVFGPVGGPCVAVTPGDGVGLAALVGGKLYAR